MAISTPWLTLHSSVDAVYSVWCGVSFNERKRFRVFYSKNIYKKDEKVSQGAQLTNSIEQNFLNWSHNFFEDYF